MGKKGRKPKVGFDYYKSDTDRFQDIKIQRLVYTFSCTGVSIYDYLLAQIYRDKGCYMPWDDNTAFVVAKYFGVKEALVKEVVNYCGSVGLFNKELLSNGTVTSLSIQERFLEMSKVCNRANTTIPKHVSLGLIPISSEEIPISSEEIPERSEEMQQRKVKESKVKENTTNTIEFKISEKIKTMANEYLTRNVEAKEAIQMHFLNGASDETFRRLLLSFCGQKTTQGKEYKNQSHFVNDVARHFRNPNFNIEKELKIVERVA